MTDDPEFEELDELPEAAVRTASRGNQESPRYPVHGEGGPARDLLPTLIGRRSPDRVVRAQQRATRTKEGQHRQQSGVQEDHEHSERLTVH